MRIKNHFISLILLVSATIALGQSDDQERLSVVFSKVLLAEALMQLDELTALDFAYDPNILPANRVINVTFDDYNIGDILDYLLAETKTGYRIIDGQIVITTKEQPSEFRISGYVGDKITNEKLAYATVYFSEIARGVTANEQGYYSIKVPAGNHSVHLGYVGRDEQTINLEVKEDVHRSFALSQIQSLDEVIVTPTAIQGSTSLHRSYQRQAVQELALETPVIGGESDVLQIVRNLPGVESNAGGVGSMFVRGGEDDQNLVLMDGVPIYYPAHLLGIYSIFNAESVRNIEVYKGGFPARYGGKLSSIIDIHTKDGRTDGWHADISGSYQSIRGAFQGPLAKGVNIMIGGRQSLTAPFINDVIGESFYRIPGEDLASDYQDFNIKLNAQIGQKGKLVLSGYKGKDIVHVEEAENVSEDEFSSNLNWSNTTLSIGYHRELGQNSFLKISQTYNSFLNEYEELLEFEEEDEEEEIGAYQYVGTFSDNKDIESKISIDHFVNPTVTNRYGVTFTAHGFTASTNNLVEAEYGEVDSSLLNLNFFPRSDDDLDASSSAIYFEQERKYSSKLFANIGLRWSGFSSDDEFYQHLEPRLNVKYIPADGWTINLSVSKMVQYIHQVSDANLSFPKDVWLPANETFLPSISWQIGGGLNKKFTRGINLDIQAYYKDLQNLNFISDIYNLSSFINSSSEEDILGQGKSYGLEISTEVPINKLLWANALTISKTTRQFDVINGELPYPFQYDRRVVLKSSMTYKASKRITIGSRLFIGTATPEYFIDPSGGSRFAFFNLSPTNPENTSRSKGHYRLDLSATFKVSSRKINHYIKANLYNLLNLKNPGFTYRDPQINNPSRTDVFSLPFIPSIQYNLSF